MIHKLDNDTHLELLPPVQKTLPVRSWEQPFGTCADTISDTLLLALTREKLPDLAVIQFTSYAQYMCGHCAGELQKPHTIRRSRLGLLSLRSDVWSYRSIDGLGGSPVLGAQSIEEGGPSFSWTIITQADVAAAFRHWPLDW
jgi:hypothetical protein